MKVSGASGSDMSGREGSAWAESANVQQQVARQNLTRDCNWHALLWWHRAAKAAAAVGEGEGGRKEKRCFEKLAQSHSLDDETRLSRLARMKKFTANSNFWPI